MCLFFVLMSWRVIYIDEGEYLSLKTDNLKIQNRKEDKELYLPLGDIHTLIVDNYRTVLSIQLINKLMDYHVNLVLCSVDHMPKTLCVPHMGNKQAPFMLRKQLAWNHNIKSRIHQAIVIAKINNQIRMLESVDGDKRPLSKLRQYKDEVTIGDKSNREGLAAKVYFRALFGPGFQRFNNDTMNAGLNYGYSILRSQISKTLFAKGLNTALAFFHHGPNNQFNLSDDFIEPFRPLIDHYVYHYLREEKLFKREHKLELIKQTTKKVKFREINQTFFNAVNQYVDTIVAFADTGDHIKLIHPVIDFDAL